MGAINPRTLERRFTARMLDIYKRAKCECGYNAARFLAMIAEHGGIETAKQLLQPRPGPDYAAGLTALCECKRLDLTVEALALAAEFAPLFSEEERRIARRERLARLRERAS